MWHFPGKTRNTSYVKTRDTFPAYTRHFSVKNTRHFLCSTPTHVTLLRQKHATFLRPNHATFSTPKHLALRRPKHATQLRAEHATLSTPKHVALLRPKHALHWNSWIKYVLTKNIPQIENSSLGFNWSCSSIVMKDATSLTLYLHKCVQSEFQSLNTSTRHHSSRLKLIWEYRKPSGRISLNWENFGFIEQW